MGLFLRKNHYLRCWVSLDWSSYIVSIPKSASKKIGTSIRSMKFFSPEVVLYLCKSTIRPALLGYCCHVWAGAPSCFLEMLDKLQKRICRAFGPSLAVSFEPLAQSQNVGSLSLLYRYYVSGCSSELSQPSSTPLFSKEVNSVTVPRFYKDVLCQHFLSSHSQTVDISIYKLLSFDR